MKATFKGYIACNDLHHGSNYAIGTIKDMYEGSTEDYFKVYLGDNIDLTGCRKKHINKYKEELEKLKNIEPNLKGTQFHIWETGNHEGFESMNNDETPSDSYHMSSNENLYIFRHLDYIFWGKKKADKFRMKEKGSGYIKWKFLSPLFQKFRSFKKFKIKDDAMVRALELAKQYEDYLIGEKFKKIFIIGGHSHPNHEVKRTEGKITLIALPRGINKRDLDL